jgi:Ca-activated chloride channel homolog
MARKEVLPIELGQHARRPEWLVRYSSWRLLFLSLALTLLLVGVGSLLVVLRQPHILQGDARWGEVRAWLLPAGLAGGFTAGVALLMLVNAGWPALAALYRGSLRGVVVVWDAGARAVEAIDVGLEWLGAAWLRPALARLAWLLRASTSLAAQAFFRPAGLALSRLFSATAFLLSRGLGVFGSLVRTFAVRPIRSVAEALVSRVARPALSLLFRGLARAYGLAAKGAGWAAAALAQTLRVLFVQPLTSAARGAGGLALRLAHGVGKGLRAFGYGLAVAGRVMGEWLRAIGLAFGRGLRSGYRGLTAGAIFRLAAVLGLILAAVGLGVAYGRYPAWRSGAGLPGPLALLFGLALALLLVAVGAAMRLRRHSLWQALRWLLAAGGAALRAVIGGLQTGLRFLRLAAAASWNGLRAVAYALLAPARAGRAWYRSRTETQSVFILTGCLLAHFALGLAIVALAYPGRPAGGVPFRSLALIFAPAAVWVMSLMLAVERVVRQPLERALDRVGQLAAAFVGRALIQPLRLFLGLILKALGLAGLGRLLFRLTLAPVGAGLRAALAGLRTEAQRFARAMAGFIIALSVAVWAVVAVPIFLVRRLFGRRVRKPLAHRGLSIRQTSSGLIITAVVLFLVGQRVFPSLGCRAGVQTLCPPAACSAPADAVVVNFYSSNTKQDWITTVTEAFNASRQTTGAGRPIFVCVTHGTSGGQYQELSQGTIQPTVWSPGDESWVDTINQLWQDRYSRPLVSEACLPTVVSPIGFAMWRSMAVALGWPDRPISWAEIVALAGDPQGWASYDHPEWGAFRFGHTHPDQSNSGLLILAALAHDVLGQTEALTSEQVTGPEFEAALRKVELHTDHYGIQSRNLINLMVELGQGYLHAVNTTETETLRTNLTRQAELPEPLAFIFPANGTYWTEQPFCLLSADWVSDEQREAAWLYGDYLRAPAQQALAPAHYLRPLDPAIPLGGPFTLANGTDPRVSTREVPALESPSGDVAALIKDMFHRTKKKATVVILLDISGSMHGEKMSNAITATVAFLRQLDRDDEVYVYAFADAVTEVAAGGPARSVEESLSTTLQGLTEGGGTALYDAVCQGSQRVAALQAAHAAAGEARLYGIVLLSDGEDTTSATAEEAMYACLPTPSGTVTKIFTIMYGSDADKRVLTEIARRTVGNLIPAEAGGIAEVYLAIAAEQ